MRRVTVGVRTPLTEWEHGVEMGLDEGLMHFVSDMLSFLCILDIYSFADSWKISA